MTSGESVTNDLDIEWPGSDGGTDRRRIITYRRSLIVLVGFEVSMLRLLPFLKRPFRPSAARGLGCRLISGKQE
jgi:hypothetical protein